MEGEAKEGRQGHLSRRRWRPGPGRASPPDAPTRRPADPTSPPEEGTGVVQYARRVQQRSGTVPVGRCEGEREAAPHADGMAGDWS
jgi:hypothetical protein